MEAGQWADRGDAILEIAQLDPIEVWIDVPERHILPMRSSGASIRVTARATGESFEATEMHIVPQGAEGARTFPVRLRLENPDRRLLPGMSVTASVPTGTVEPRLLVPADAMLRDDAGWFVYTATGETNALMALPARVEPLVSVNGMTAVRVVAGPLFPGALVVIEGNERILFPGQPLAVTNASALAPAPGAPAEPAPGGEGGRP
jgi:multidrug efflux pump subunit AcrA (membrane-fusion protein)